MNKIKGVCQNFTTADLLNSQPRWLLDNVSALWNECNAAEVAYMSRGEVICEGLGHWYNQTAWTNEGGYFIKFRLAPLDATKPRAQAKVSKIINAFVEIFPNAKAHIDDPTELGKFTDTVTVIVHTSTDSIGD